MFEFDCYYGGSGKNKSNAYYYDGWYALSGSINVNRTDDDVFDGVNVEYLSDYDAFTASSSIECLEDLINEVES
jgi:hypothetical protein